MQLQPVSLPSVLLFTMPVPVSDFVTIHYRPDLQVLTARWLRPVVLDEMCEAYEAMLATAKPHNCRHWLIDARRRHNTDREGAGWMLGNFLPRVQQQLGGRPALAYLLAPMHLRDPLADAAFPALSYFDDKPFVGRQFIEEGAAVEWLQHLQAAETPA